MDETTSCFSGSSASFHLRFAVALIGLSSIELIQPASGLTIGRFAYFEAPDMHLIVDASTGGNSPGA